jgi:hypothetical protein
VTASRASAVVTLLGGLALLAACAEPTPTTESSESVESVEPSVTASAAAPEELGANAIAMVAVGALVVRDAPDAEALALPDGLVTGDRAFVIDAVTESGSPTWYLVAPLGRPDGSIGPVGWVAAADDGGEPTLEVSPATCPAEATLATVLELHPYERVTCFGDRPVRLESAFLTCGIADGPLQLHPEWLNGSSGCGLALDDSGDAVLLLRTPPGMDGVAPDPAGGAMQVTGHFNDPAAIGCTASSSDPAIPVPIPAATVLECRAEFVLESTP